MQLLHFYDNQQVTDKIYTFDNICELADGQPGAV